jgi:hypothetical protein
LCPAGLKRLPIFKPHPHPPLAFPAAFQTFNLHSPGAAAEYKRFYRECRANPGFRRYFSFPAARALPIETCGFTGRILFGLNEAELPEGFRVRPSLAQNLDHPS